MDQTPGDLDPACKLTLIALFTFAHPDGGGIYASAETIATRAGLPVSTIYRCLTMLEKRELVVPDGWYKLAGRIKTRQRRIVLAKLERGKFRIPHSLARERVSATKTLASEKRQTLASERQTGRAIITGGDEQVVGSEASALRADAPDGASHHDRVFRSSDAAKEARSTDGNAITFNGMPAAFSDSQDIRTKAAWIEGPRMIASLTGFGDGKARRLHRRATA